MYPIRAKDGKDVCNTRHFLLDFTSKHRKETGNKIWSCQCQILLRLPVWICISLFLSRTGRAERSQSMTLTSHASGYSRYSFFFKPGNLTDRENNNKKEDAVVTTCYVYTSYVKMLFFREKFNPKIRSKRIQHLPQCEIWEKYFSLVCAEVVEADWVGRSERVCNQFPRRRRRRVANERERKQGGETRLHHAAVRHIFCFPERMHRFQLSFFFRFFWMTVAHNLTASPRCPNPISHCIKQPFFIFRSDKCDAYEADQPRKRSILNR